MEALILSLRRTASCDMVRPRKDATRRRRALSILIFAIPFPDLKNTCCPRTRSIQIQTQIHQSEYKRLSDSNRVYLHGYISTVAVIFEAPPNEISSPTQ